MNDCTGGCGHSALWIDKRLIFVIMYVSSQIIFLVEPREANKESSNRIFGRRTRPSKTKEKFTENIQTPPIFRLGLLY